ncbi:MAG: hypothetical protein MUF71_10790 [Candidatus Kapabacteria bacterium]|nr:hypothetical protein [Candidatus Kapabacteria bacterium]
MVNQFILTYEVYYQGFSQQITATQVEAFIEMRSEYWWIGAVLPFFIVPLKVLYVATCLSVGLIIIGSDISVREVFRLALLSEIVFIADLIIQVFCGIFLIEVRIPDDYANFAPLSALQFFDVSSLKLWMKHPLRTLNLFEVAYMLVLAYFLTPLLKKRTYLQTLGLVVSSYGLGLLLWVVALAFLLLQVS